MSNKNIKLNKDDELCTEKYTFQGKVYLKIIVQKRNKDGKMIKKSSRFTKSGNRILSIKSAEAVKYWLKNQLEQVVDEKSIYTWQAWREKTVHEMRKDGYMESTLKTYEGTLNKWIDPAWLDKELSSFTRDDVFEFIHEYLVNKEATSWTRKNICKKVHKLFELAVDHGELSRNPCRGIKVDAKASEGLALTPGEVEILLTKAKAINHDYFPHWVLALMTGMRCGELYALRWSDIDFEAGVIRVLRQYTSKDGLHPPKRGKTRPIDLSPELKSFLTVLKQKHGLAQQKLWTWKSERQMVDEIVCGRKTGKQISKLNKVKDYITLDDLVLPRVRSWMMGMQAKRSPGIL
ncbi:MAG: tyrosine-type recombinase/integrase [Bdellovibrionaceae bacterium]|jgi:integrase|nr:tyrosine-type recombinase/integrase [Pseudobdellovibrionaceae bacterium]